MKRLLFLLPLLLLLLASCNLRENLLLPPELSAADYLSGNLIESYANYLVKSDNDDSYLFIPKTSIADSLINYNDEIIFRRVSSFASRDSLAFQSAANPLSDTYQFFILRNGARIDFYPQSPLATIFTNLEPSPSPYYYVNYSYYLQAAPLDADFYGTNRAAIPVLSTGEFAIYGFGQESAPSLQFSGNSQVHALLMDDSGKQLAINFPAAYSAAAGSINLTMNSGLNQSDQTLLQHYYPHASISTPIFELITASSPGAELALVRFTTPAKSFFGKQWTMLSGTSASSWPETDQDSGSANWWQDATGLYSFLKGTGSYFLLTPLESQSAFTIPLDGSVSQVFLQELWFDLNNLLLPYTSMEVNLAPDFSPYQDSYFGGKPFTINGNHQLFEINFFNGSTPLVSLPDDAWLEFGFRTSLPVTAYDRLFYIYRDASQDFITYKTAGAAYDATHYSRSANYVYSGLALSGAYLYGSVTDGILQQIPYLKPQLYLQSSRSIVSWKNSAKRSYSHLTLQHAPSLPAHPWLQGEPLTLSAPQALADISSYSGTTQQSTLPGSFQLSLPISVAPQNLLLFAASPYPRLRNYHQDSSHTGSSFVMDNGRLNIYPAYPGILISSAISTLEELPLRIYPTMSFLWKDIILNTYGHASGEQSSIITIQELPYLADPYGILPNQYSLAQNSMAFSISASSPSDYSLFEPMLFFKRSLRGLNILFYESLSPFYRLYPYQESSEYDPWHFIVDNGYNGISLAYDGTYASYTDLNPHSSISTIIADPPWDTVLSLYQAQLVVPGFFADSTLPLTSTISLTRLSSLPGVPNLLAAYNLSFVSSSGTAFLPNFYQVLGATQELYIYIPVEDISAIPSARMFFRDYLGQVIELTRVDSFSDSYATEYRVLGNSFICTVPNPGIFYISTDN